MSDSSRLQRNQIFAKGLKSTATYAVRIGSDIFKFIVNFIKEMVTTALGGK